MIGCFSRALIGIANQPVSRTADSAAASVQNVWLYRRSTNALVAKSF